MVICLLLCLYLSLSPFFIQFFLNQIAIDIFTQDRKEAKWMDGWMHTEEKKKKELLECSELVLPLLSHGFLFLCLSPTCILPGCSRNLDSNMRWKVSVVNAIGAYPDPLLASTFRCQLLWVLADNNSLLSFSLKIFPQQNGKHLDQETLPTTLPP